MSLWAVFYGKILCYISLLNCYWS